MVELRLLVIVAGRLSLVFNAALYRGRLLS